MASFHSPCQEQRLLLSVFLTSSLNPVVCFDLKKKKPNKPTPKQTARNWKERAGKQAAREERKEADWKVTGLGVRSHQPLPRAAGKLPPARPLNWGIFEKTNPKQTNKKDTEGGGVGGGIQTLQRIILQIPAPIGKFAFAYAGRKLEDC